MLHTYLAFALMGILMIMACPVGVVLFLLDLVGLKKLSRAGVVVVAKVWAWSVIWATRCRLEVSGQENIPKEGGFCIVSNHSGIFDIVLHLGLSGRRVGFIARKELVFIPFLNLWILLVGGLFINRENPREALKTISDGARRIRKGDVMLIFPEGTRSRGRGLLPFKAGSFKLATAAGAPIIPAAITGSYELLEKNNRLTPCPVFVSYGKPILTADLKPEERRQELSSRVYAVIDALLVNHKERATLLQAKKP